MGKLSTFRHILILEDDLSKRVLSLEKDCYTLGRDSSNDLIIHDRQVSRHHATLIKKSTLDNLMTFYQIVDGDLEGNRSTNGVLINEKLCLEYNLKHGDIIRFGGKSKASYYIISNISMIDFLTDNQEEERLIKNLEESSKITIPSTNYSQEDDKDNQKELIRLASFPELSPNPIIEINWQGEITYLNSAASLKFRDIYHQNLNHPILAGLITLKFKNYGSLLVREVQIGDEFFEEYIHYLSERNLIRIYIFDLTERKKSEISLRESEEKYKAVVGQICEGICLVDAFNHQVLEANQAYANLLGYTLEEIRELTLDKMVDKGSLLTQELPKVIKHKTDFWGEVNYVRQDGSVLKTEVSISLINFNRQEVLCFAVRDITERKRAEAILQYHAYHDLLTGLPNRSFFEQTLATALSNAERFGAIIAIMFLDLDDFKAVNDNLGHSTGDELLKSFAERLKSCLRTGDTIARWGGDEFVILTPAIQNLENVQKLAQRLLDSLQQPFNLSKEELAIKISIGIALYPQDGEHPKTLLHNADIALYRAKDTGKNQYQFYSL